MQNYNAKIHSLPIFPHLDKICDELKKSPSRFLVLTAETAAGKSTALPLALLKNFSGKIVMLEPRRLAAKTIAERVASLLGEKCGETCGYTMHLESKTSKATRFEVITEAILTRRLQTDSLLEDVNVVVIDEFHERTIHADLSLSFLKETMLLREDLFVIVMSATIDAEKLCAFLNAPLYQVPGRQFPVAYEYWGDFVDSRAPLGVQMADAIKRVLHTEKSSGNILAFLPGLFDLKTAAQVLTGSDGYSDGCNYRCNDGCNDDAEIFLLHSSVPFEKQQRIFADDTSSTRRKIILSSAIAETSLTVPGVDCVVDCGFSRVSRMNAATGMTHLVTEIESEFSAVQRAGRAGRLHEGLCIRLWNECDKRVAKLPAEILRSDLIPLVLECANWGAKKIDALDWLDAPSVGGWNAAKKILSAMNLISVDGAILPDGKLALKLGVHPRIATMIINAKKCGNIAAKNFALDIAVQNKQSDERQKLESSIEKIIAREFATEKIAPKKMTFAEVVLSGYPDRLGKLIAENKYQFPSGRVASSNGGAEWIVAFDVDAGEREGKIYSAIDLQTDETEQWLATRTTESIEIFFDENKTKKIVRLKYGEIIVKEFYALATESDKKIALCNSIKKNGIEYFPWNKASRGFFLRAKFFASHIDSIVGVNKTELNFSPEEFSRDSEKYLLDEIESWLLPFIPNGEKLTPEIFCDALRYKLNGTIIDKYVPEKITLENGKNRRISFDIVGDEIIPTLEVIIQEIFGCKTTPKLCGIPVLLKLLSPARRPLQVTRDLEGFWKNTWQEICKEMKGRYPKHNWNSDIVL